MTQLRQPRGIAFTIRDPLPWDDVAAIARAGEQLGYTAVFLPEIETQRDTLATLAGLAGETSQLLLGTGVIPMRSRTPELAAMAAATVQDRSGGRLVLGVGTGGSAPGALDRLTAYVGALRQQLDRSKVLTSSVPVWISALGPRATRVAGEIADGVILNWCTPERVAEARQAIQDAAVAVGRDPDAVTVSVYVRAAFGERADEALLAAASEYVTYESYARQFRHMGVGPTAEAVVDAVCLRGDPEAARTRLDTYRAAGADLLVVYPVLAAGEGRDVSVTTLSALAPEGVNRASTGATLGEDPQISTVETGEMG